MNSIQEAKKMVVFIIKRIRKPYFDVENFVVDNFIFRPTKTTLYKHIFNIAPRIHTPYGMAPALYIIEQPNGLYDLRQWYVRQSIEENLSLEEAETALFNYYEDCFRTNQSEEKNFYMSSVEAIGAISRIIAKEQNISLDEAKKQWEHEYTSSYEPKENIHQIDESLFREEYMNLIPYIPGETFNETKQRLANAFPERLPPQEFNTIVRILRRKWINQNVINNQKTLKK